MKVSDKPSIFSDRSGIGSSEELDEYGVWVKSEPEDLPASAGDDGSFFNEPAALSLPDALSDDGSFDIDFSTDAVAETGEGAAPFDLDDETIFGSETFDRESDALLSDSAALANTEFFTEELESTTPEAGEINEAAFDFNGFVEETEVPVTSDDGAELTVNSSETASEENAAPPLDDTEAVITESDFSDDDPFAALDSSFSDFEETAGIAPVSLDSSEINLTIDNVVTGEMPSEPETEIFLNTETDAEDTEADATETPAENFAPLTSSREMPSDIAAFQTTAAAPKPQAASDENNLSTELLRKIASELSTIKTELDDLKSEISGLKSAAQQQAHPFIDEEVTLTGEELNDVINSAEVTSETDVLPETADAIPAMFMEENIPVEETTQEAGPQEDGTAVLPDDINGLDDESISLTAHELGGLDDVDESISLFESELNSLDEIDESISISADELEHIDDVSAQIGAANALEMSEEQAAGGEDLDAALNISDNVLEDSLPAEADIDLNVEPLDIDLQLDEELLSDRESAFDGHDSSTPPEETLAVDLPVSEEMDILDNGEANNAEPMMVTAAPVKDLPDAEAPAEKPRAPEKTQDKITEKFKNEIRTVLAYMDQLLESLPEEKIEEFARSDKFDVYKKVFKDLGLV